MKIAMLAPIAWRTPPRHYGPWERVTSLLTEELVRLGVDVTLFATRDSVTSATLRAVCDRGYEEDPDMNAKVWECLHISECFEHADDFDIIHNQFDFLPLSYSALVSTPVVTTIHGFPLLRSCRSTESTTTVTIMSPSAMPTEIRIFLMWRRSTTV